MRREISSPRTTPLSVGREPPAALTDGVVTVRTCEPGDVGRLARYAADESLLEGGWAGWLKPGEAPLPWARGMVTEWKRGWSPEGSIECGALIVDEQQPFVGIVALVPRSERVVELVYGVAPPFRGRGIAARAARLVANWALGDGDFDRVELRIGEDHAVSRRVAENAGFVFMERFETFVTGTGQVYVDTLYALDAEAV